MVTGVMARTILVKSIYKRGVSLTGKARMEISNSDLMNHISTDVRYLYPREYIFINRSSVPGQPNRLMRTVVCKSFILRISYTNLPI